MTAEHLVGADSVLAIAIRVPSVVSSTASLRDLRRQLASDHVHLALVVDDDGVLRACVTDDDLRDLDRDDDAGVVGVGTLEGRVVAATARRAEVESEMARLGVRRLAVVDDEGRLVGLVCRKRSGTGFCTDEGVASRQAERLDLDARP